MLEEDFRFSQDSLASLLLEETEYPPLIKPPETPKPTVRDSRPRRASSVVRSPYLASVPKVQYSGSGRSQKKIVTQSQEPRKRKRALSSTVTKHAWTNDLSEDFSGKTALDLRDELTSTQRTLSVTRQERDGLKGELQKLKQLLEKKDKEVEDLIIGGHVSQQDKTRIISGNKTDTLLTITSLKHRLHTFERSLRDKETELSSLKTDIKATRLKELEAEKEIYYQEILRLQMVVEQLKRELNVQVPQSKKQLHHKLTEMEATLEGLTSRNKQLKLEKDKLCKQLGHWQDNGKNTYPMNDERASKYLTLTQGAAVTALVQLELTLQERNDRIVEGEERLKKQTEDYETKFLELSSQITLKDEEISQLNDKVKQLEKRCLDCEADLTNLKEDLSSIQERLKTELSIKEEAISALKVLQDEQEKEKLAREYSQKLTNSRHQMILQTEDHRKQSAIIIQKRWRRYNAKKKQAKFQDEENQLIATLQNIMRGHQIRQSFIIRCTDLDDNDRLDDRLVKTVQGLVSGHHTRQQFLHDNIVVP